MFSLNKTKEALKRQSLLLTDKNFAESADIRYWRDMPINKKESVNIDSSKLVDGKINIGDAYKRKDIQSIEIIEKKIGNLNLEINAHDWSTPLELAIEAICPLPVIKLLIKKGANPIGNPRNYLHMVFKNYWGKQYRRERNEVLKFLLKNGADPNLPKDKNDRSTPDLLIELFLGNLHEYHPGQRVHVETAKLLVKHGADPFILTESGHSLMHLTSPYIENIEYLLELGLALNQRSPIGVTPLKWWLEQKEDYLKYKLMSLDDFKKGIEYARSKGAVE